MGDIFRHQRVCEECSKPQTEKELTCEKCKKKFIVTKYESTNSFKKQRFCSPFCASSLTEFVDGEVKLKQQYGICKYCGKQIPLVYKGMFIRPRTVCDDCLKPKIKPEFKTKICSVCGKEFQVGLEPCGDYSATQYCSDECAKIGFNQKCIKTCQEKIWC